MSERLPKKDLYSHAVRYLTALYGLTDGIPSPEYSAKTADVKEKLDGTREELQQVELFLGGGLEGDGLAWVRWGPGFGSVSMTELGVDDHRDGFPELRRALRIAELEETPPWLDELLSLAGDKVGIVWRNERKKTEKELGKLRENLARLGTYSGTATLHGTMEILEGELNNTAAGILASVATLLDETNEPLTPENEKHIKDFCLEKFGAADDVEGPMKVFDSEMTRAHQTRPPSSASKEIRRKMLASKGRAHRDLEVALKDYLYKRRLKIAKTEAQMGDGNKSGNKEGNRKNEPFQEQSQKIEQHFYNAPAPAIASPETKSEDGLREAKRSFYKNPLPWVAAVGVVALIAGVLLGRNDFSFMGIKATPVNEQPANEDSSGLASASAHSPFDGDFQARISFSDGSQHIWSLAADVADYRPCGDNGNCALYTSANRVVIHRVIGPTNIYYTGPEGECFFMLDRTPQSYSFPRQWVGRHVCTTELSHLGRHADSFRLEIIE